MSPTPSHRTLALVALVTGLGVIAFGARTALQAQITNVFTTAAQAEEGFTIEPNRNTIFFCLVKPTGGTTFMLLDPSLQNRAGLSLEIQEYTGTVNTQAKRFVVGGTNNTLTVFQRGKLYMVRSNQEVFFRCDQGLSSPAETRPIALPSALPAEQEREEPQAPEYEPPLEETEIPVMVTPPETSSFSHPLRVALESPTGELVRGRPVFLSIEAQNTGKNTLDEVGFTLSMPEGYMIPVGGTSGNCSGVGNEVSCQNFVLAPDERLMFRFPFLILPDARCDSLEQTRIAAQGHVQGLNDLPMTYSNFVGWTVSCTSASSSAASRMTEPTSSAPASFGASQASSAAASPLLATLSGPNGLQTDENATYTLVLKNTTTATTFRDLSFYFPFPEGITTDAQTTTPNCTVSATGFGCIGILLQPQLSLTLSLPLKTLSTLPCSVIPLKATATANGLKADSNTINVQGCTGNTPSASVVVSATINSEKGYLEKNVKHRLQLQIAALGTAFSGGTLRVFFPEGFETAEVDNSLAVGTCHQNANAVECTDISRSASTGVVYQIPFVIQDSATCGKANYTVTFTYLENGLEKTITKNQSMQLCHAAPVETGPLDRFSIETHDVTCLTADCRMVMMSATLKNTGPTPATNTIIAVNLDPSWKTVTLNGAPCLIIDLPGNKRMFDCPGSNYLTIPAGQEITYTLVMETDAACPLATPRTAVLVQSTPASVYEEDYSNNSVYATLPPACQNQPDGGDGGGMPAEEQPSITSIEISSDFNIVTATLSEDPGVRTLLAFEISREGSEEVLHNGGLVQAGQVITITGFARQLSEEGPGVYTLKFAACPERMNLEGAGIREGCGATFTKTIDYRPSVKPFTGSVTFYTAHSVTLKISRTLDAYEYAFGSCTSAGVEKVSQGFTKNTAMVVSDLTPDTPYVCNLYIVPTPDGGTILAKSANISIRTKPDSNVQAIPRADVRVSMAGPQTATRGSSVSYVLTVMNDGPDPTSAFTLMQQPQGLVFNPQLSDARCAIETEGTPRLIRCDIGTLQKSDVQKANLAFTVDPNTACDSVSTVHAAAFLTSFDPEQTNNGGGVLTKVACSAAGGGMVSCYDQASVSAPECGDGTVRLKNISHRLEKNSAGTATMYTLVELEGPYDPETDMVFLTVGPFERGEPNYGTINFSTNVAYGKTYERRLTISRRAQTATSTTSAIVLRTMLDPVTISPPTPVFSTQKTYGMFVTAAPVMGNLDTGDPRIAKTLPWTARANLICNLAAQDAGLSPSNSAIWQATLTDSHAMKYPLYNMKNELLAETEADLWASNRGRLPALLTDQFGDDIYGSAWTGRDPTGTITTETCSGWSTKSNQYKGAIGVVNGGGTEWVQVKNQSCGLSAHLYCVSTSIE